MKKPSSRTIPTLLEEMASRQPQREFIVDGLRRWTYAAFYEEVTRVAGALVSNGVGRGDRVGILAGNRAEWLSAYFASMSIGAISVGLNTWSTPRELGYQLAHAEVKVLFLEPHYRDRDFTSVLAQARTLNDGLPNLKQIVALDGDTHDFVQYDEWCRDASNVSTETLASFAEKIQARDVACLLYTSGSTALPKGVPLLHGGLIDNMWEIGERQHLQVDDRLWLAVSLFWSLACVNAVFALLTHGGTIVLQHHFDPGDALKLIEAERCTVFYGTPNMALALSEDPTLRERDLSSLRTGVTIGTPAQVQRIADLGVQQICNVYGLTEAYGNSTVTDAALSLEQRISSVGQALSGVEVQVVEPDTMAPLPINTPGEIVLRGNVTPGYWADPIRSAEAFTEDGWFRTGDLGLLDAEAFLYYRGRLKEMVKTGGINVAPAEVEEVLASHPTIELAFVTGIADERLDEALAAIIVFRRGMSCEQSELSEHCRASLATYKTPRHYRFVDASELPLTTTGKLQRNRLAELFS